MAGDSSLSGRSGIRGRLWTIIFEAETKSGKAFDVLLLWAIGLSVVAVMLDSIDSFAMRWGGALKVAEWGFTLLFMTEYFVRIWVVRRPARYIFSFFGKASTSMARSFDHSEWTHGASSSSAPFSQSATWTP